MNQKRARSSNWDEEEKQLFRFVLKEYGEIIENKSLDTNSIKKKKKAWEEVHKKFNELNGRHRQLSQLKIQWKTMKVNARKTYCNSKTNITKTGGGTRLKTPDDAVIKDLLNPAGLLRDQNIYDSDGIVLKRKFNLNTENVLKNKKNHEDYVSCMVRRSEMLKDEHHIRILEMAEEEHALKMEILRENLKAAILEREILEIKYRNLE